MNVKSLAIDLSRVKTDSGVVYYVVDLVAMVLIVYTLHRRETESERLRD